MQTTDTILLEINDLTMKAGTAGKVVHDVSLRLHSGEVLGIVGESGSGKTLLAKAIMRLQAPVIQIEQKSSIRFNGEEMTTMSYRDLRRLRGAGIGMVFQEPMTSLNPSMKIGRQLEEAMRLHLKLTANERQKRILNMLTRIGIHNPVAALEAYPHQFSGGMRQRIMLASVMLLEPRLLIADEPTTALDAVVQREVLELMLELTASSGTAVMLISHDLAVVAQYTDCLAVMKGGHLVEAGKTAEILTAPQHDYTRKLIAALPHRGRERHTQFGAPLIEAKNIAVDFGGFGNFFSRTAPKRAVHQTDFTIRQGEIVALVGASGSGKTTLGRVLAGLQKPSEGQVIYRGQPLVQHQEGWRDYRLDCQMIFQDPLAAMDPRMRVGEIIAEPLRHSTLDKAACNEKVDAIIQEVGLRPEHADRFPHELSGGQRQRVVIARAVIRNPSLVICDEPVSALDMTVRAQILALFANLQEKHGFAGLFISHDLGAVEQIADRVVVMDQGRIIEMGSVEQVFDQPQHDYTRSLLAAIPMLKPNASHGVQIQWRS